MDAHATALEVMIDFRCQGIQLKCSHYLGFYHIIELECMRASVLLKVQGTVGQSCKFAMLKETAPDKSP